MPAFSDVGSAWDYAFQSASRAETVCEEIHPKTVFPSASTIGLSKTICETPVETSPGVYG